MQVTYCRRWNFDKHLPIDPYDQHEALRQDAAGELYTVALGDPSQPAAVLEVVWENKHLSVWFFDRLLRQSISYEFTRVDEKRMFLKNIIRWEYPDDNARGLNENSLIEEIRYNEDGEARHIVKDKAARERRTTDRHSVNIDINWEDVPTFGDWASVARYNREITPSQSSN